MKYRPLPFYLTIKESKIHGLGLYSLAQIPKDTTIGMTHIQIENDIIRTPLGGFFNHSKKPNCEAVYDGDFIKIITLYKTLITNITNKWSFTSVSQNMIF